MQATDSISIVLAYELQVWKTAIIVSREQIWQRSTALGKLNSFGKHRPSRFNYQIDSAAFKSTIIIW